MKPGSDLALILSTFASIFLAELGDKTQLATMALAGDAPSARSRWLVFAGASLALVACSAVGVLGGAVLSRVVSPMVIKRAAGALFVAMGVWMLVSKAG